MGIFEDLETRVSKVEQELAAVKQALTSTPENVNPLVPPDAGTVQSGNEPAATAAPIEGSGTPEQGNSEQQPKEGANAPAASPSEVPAGEGRPGAAT